MASRSKSKGGFPLTGKAKNSQFTERVRGNKETGFKQWTAAAVTAANQGRAMPSDKTKADAGPRKDAKRQFGKTGGKSVF